MAAVKNPVPAKKLTKQSSIFNFITQPQPDETKRIVNDIFGDIIQAVLHKCHPKLHTGSMVKDETLSLTLLLQTKYRSLVEGRQKVASYLSHSTLSYKTNDVALMLKSYLYPQTTLNGRVACSMSKTEKKLVGLNYSGNQDNKILYGSLVSHGNLWFSQSQSYVNI